MKEQCQPITPNKVQITKNPPIVNIYLLFFLYQIWINLHLSKCWVEQSLKGRKNKSGESIGGNKLNWIAEPKWFKELLLTSYFIWLMNSFLWLNYIVASVVVYCFIEVQSKHVSKILCISSYKSKCKWRLSYINL